MRRIYFSNQIFIQADTDTALEAIMEILLRQRFFTALSNAVNSFWPHELVNGSVQCLTTCDVIRVFCAILVNLIALKPNIILELSNNVAVEIVRLISIVVQQQPATSASLLMLREICNFTIGACAVDSSLLQQISVQERPVIAALLSCLDSDLYSHNNALKVKCFESVLVVLDELCGHSRGEVVVCTLLAEEDAWNNLLDVVEVGLKSYKKNRGENS